MDNCIWFLLFAFFQGVKWVWYSISVAAKQARSYEKIRDGSVLGLDRGRLVVPL